MSRFWSSPVSSRGCPGTAPLCAARCPASLVKVVLARYGRPSRAAFPVAGAKADAGWNGFLWPVGRARRQRVADAQHAAVLAASFHTCRGAHAAVPPGILRFSRSSGGLAADSGGCLVAHAGPLQRSVISLRGAYVSAKRAFLQNPRRAQFKQNEALKRPARHRRCQRTSGCTVATADCHTNHISTTRSASSRNRRRRAKGGPESARAKRDVLLRPGRLLPGQQRRRHALLGNPAAAAAAPRAAAAAVPEATDDDEGERPRVWSCPLPVDDECVVGPRVCGALPRVAGRRRAGGHRHGRVCTDPKRLRG